MAVPGGCAGGPKAPDPAPDPEQTQGPLADGRVPQLILKICEFYTLLPRSLPRQSRFRVDPVEKKS